ncbi:MAG: hypothetical protein NT157_04995 [Candidatus Micrarchaeota archaeon]|nr:hypothetical protein [Candidatus Micrarchaeota archaeon]
MIRFSGKNRTPVAVGSGGANPMGEFQRAAKLFEDKLQRDTRRAWLGGAALILALSAMAVFTAGPKRSHLPVESYTVTMPAGVIAKVVGENERAVAYTVGGRTVYALGVDRIGAGEWAKVDDAVRFGKRVAGVDTVRMGDIGEQVITAVVPFRPFEYERAGNTVTHPRSMAIAANIDGATSNRYFAVNWTEAFCALKDIGDKSQGASRVEVSRVEDQEAYGFMYGFGLVATAGMVLACAVVGVINLVNRRKVQEPGV